MPQQIGLREYSHLKRHTLSPMKDQLVENFFLSLLGTVVQKALACSLDDPKIVHVGEVLRRSPFFCEWHGKNENAARPEQSPAIDECTVDGSNGDMLENVTRNEEPVFANLVIRNIRDIQIRFGMIEGIGVRDCLGKRFGISVPVTHTESEDGLIDRELRQYQRLAEKLDCQCMHHGTHPQAASTVAAGWILAI